jgi:phage-related protein
VFAELISLSWLPRRPFFTKQIMDERGMDERGREAQPDVRAGNGHQKADGRSVSAQILEPFAKFTSLKKGAFRIISFLVYWDMSWTVETLNETVDAEVEALPEDMRARLARIAKLIEEKGLERVGEPHVKQIEGRIWEMRMKGRSGISRALYVTAVGRRVVIVRVFVKKTEKTPRREIDLALTRAKSV